MARELGMKTSEFTKKHCEQLDGIWKLKDGVKGNCRFLEGRRCGIYEGRPTQCRTWPFWPETLKAKTWNKEVRSFCPGVGRGRLWSAEEIEAVLNEQTRSEEQYGS